MKLIFLDHFLGGVELEKYKNIYRTNLIFASFGYDSEVHWSTPSIVKDTVKEINKLVKKYNIRKVILIGVSMGGTTVLNVLCNADQKLQEKITNVFAVFPIINYEYTLKNTKRTNIRDALTEHFSKFKNPEEIMKQSSPITFVDSIPRNTSIVLFEGILDSHVCSDQIEKYYGRIKKINPNNILIKWNVDHLLTEVESEYAKLILQLLS